MNIFLTCKCCGETKNLCEYSPRNKSTCKACVKIRVDNYNKNKGSIVKLTKEEQVQIRTGRDVVKIDPKEFGPVIPARILKRRKQKEEIDKALDGIVKKQGNAAYKRNAEKLKNRREKHPEQEILLRAKSRAKEKGLDFNLEIQDILIPTHCPILGIPLVPNNGTISIDRIIPSLGYVKGNIWIISKKANTMKNNATPEELRLFGKWAVNFYCSPDVVPSSKPSE